MLTGRRAVVEVVSKSGIRGLLFMDSGSVRHAICEELTGEKAFYQCLTSSGGSFSNLPWEEPKQITIDKPGDFLLMEAARKRDEARKEYDAYSD